MASILAIGLSVIGALVMALWLATSLAVGTLAVLNAWARRRQDPWRGPAVADVDLNELVASLESDLVASRAWATDVQDGSAVVSSGTLTGIACRAYRSEVILDGSEDAVVTYLADEMVERLPEWNREFESGEMLRELSEPKLGDDDKAWLYRVTYKTPWPLMNREYVYFLARKRLSPTATLIAYQSVTDGPKPSPGCVRGVLFRTVHRCEELPDGRTKVEHILANDIGGGFSHWLQNTLLKSELVAANLRDAVNQRAIFRKRT